MLISCILTSFNRPNFFRQALRSVERQSWRNFELLVMDDSDSEILDARAAVSEFEFPVVRVWVSGGASGKERATTNRLAKQINLALDHAWGDLICYLADDDYYFPDWFEQGVRFFDSNQHALQGFGSLHYSSSPHMDYSQTGAARFPGAPVSSPYGALDHSQVMHRRRVPPVLWPEQDQARSEPDAWFFRELAKDGPFYPIPDGAAAVKRLHPKCLQRTAGGPLKGPRE